MPKLNAGMAKKVKETDTSNPFAALPEGRYLATLTKVESGKSKSSGKNMWTWTFRVVDTKKDLREYTLIDDEALWKVAQIFEAFGVSPDTSTDELLGKKILLHIGTEVQTQGKGKGQLRNYIVAYPDQNLEPEVFEETEDDEEEAPKPAPKKRAAAKKAEADEAPDF